MRFDAISAVEACYRHTPTEPAWFEAILATMKPFERGFGANAMSFRMRGGSAKIENFVSTAGSAEQVREMVRLLESMPPLVLDSVILRPGVGRASDRFRAAPRVIIEEYGGLLQQTSTVDAIGVVARDHDGCGTHISFPVVPGTPALSPRGRSQLSMIAAHLVSARRLRDVVGPPGPDADSVDAVLDPSGRVLDARGEVESRAQRERVSSAVARIERARGRLRRTDPDEALDLWKALVSGTWSLVEHCESDGRRLILARRNRPGVQDPKALAPRERDVLAYAVLGHSNKYIGYMLGLAPSTVAEHLDKAQRKLGAGSRREIIALFAGSSAAAV